MLFRNGNLPDSDNVEPVPGDPAQGDDASLAKPWYGRTGSAFSRKVIL